MSLLPAKVVNPLWRKVEDNFVAKYLRRRKQIDLVTMQIEIDGKKRGADGSWYRGEATNFGPTKADLQKPDAIRQYILHGWLPDAPFITRETYITAFGSCFARHVTNYLYDQGYKVFGRNLSRSSYVVRCGEGLVNTFSVLQQFQWAFGEKDFDNLLWHDKDGNTLEYSDAVRSETLGIFRETDIFIITLGLSEVWYNKQTGDAFMRAIPKSEYDPVIHGFKNSSVEENRANIAEIYRIIRRHKPHAKVIFTLSPVPLVATFRPVSCVTANAVSKAVLRVAVDEVMRANAGDGQLYYFPSYEIVREFAHDPYKDDNRHVRHEVISLIMETFRRHYCTD